MNMTLPMLLCGLMALTSVGVDSLMVNEYFSGGPWHLNISGTLHGTISYVEQTHILLTTIASDHDITIIFCDNNDIRDDIQTSTIGRQVMRSEPYSVIGQQQRWELSLNIHKSSLLAKLATYDGIILCTARGDSQHKQSSTDSIVQKHIYPFGLRLEASPTGADIVVEIDKLYNITPNFTTEFIISKLLITIFVTFASVIGILITYITYVIVTTNR